MTLRLGCLFIDGNNGESYSIPLNGATFVKKISDDPEDDAIRFELTYTPADGTGATEKITLKPSRNDAWKFYEAVQSHITEASKVASQWVYRYYEINGGMIDAYTDNESGGRVLEFSITIKPDFKVEQIALPDHPFCVRIITKNGKEQESIIIESDSHDDQMEWIEKLYDAIQATATNTDGYHM